MGLPAKEANFSSAQLAWNEQSVIDDVSTWGSVQSRQATKVLLNL